MARRRSKPSRPLPEVLVRQKAHELWRQRQQAGSLGDADKDWAAATAFYQQHPWRVRRWQWLRPLHWLFNSIGPVSPVIRGVNPIIQFFAVIFEVPRLWPGLLRQSNELLKNPETRPEGLEILKTILSGLTLFGTAIAGFALLLNFWDASADRRLTGERLVTDRYVKAVELLEANDKDGNQKMSVRSGGIYSLERIAKDSPRDHWTIIEVLTTYIQQESLATKAIESPACMEKPLANRDEKCLKLVEEWVRDNKVSLDIQATLTVIGRRETQYDCYQNQSWWERLSQRLKTFPAKVYELNEGLNQRLKTFPAKVYGLNKGLDQWLKTFPAKLQRKEEGGKVSERQCDNQFQLSSSKLIGAKLFEADLRGAYLRWAYLRWAYLRWAYLRWAYLRWAYLREAKLVGADLSGADLRDADLNGTIFWSTKRWLNEDEAKNITPEQIKRAKNWEKGIYSPAFRQKLGLR